MELPAWYQKLNDFLVPLQPVVKIGLFIIILAAAYVLWKGDKVQRTALFTFLIA